MLDNNGREIARAMTNAEGAYAFDVSCESSYTIKGAKEDYDPVEAPLMTTTAFEYEHQLPLKLKKRPVFEEGVDLAKLLGVIIYFDTAKADIRPDAAQELQKIVKVLKDYPELKIDVRSHTDSRSSARYNRSLSERRVQSTIKYIVEVGGIDKSCLLYTSDAADD